MEIAWKDIKEEQPPLGVFVCVVLEHWHTKGRRPAGLKRVDEDDVCWRFDDGSEPSYDWNVILWTPVPEGE